MFFLFLGIYVIFTVMYLFVKREGRFFLFCVLGFDFRVFIFEVGLGYFIEKLVVCFSFCRAF